jgi:hypothetical protein
MAVLPSVQAEAAGGISQFSTAQQQKVDSTDVWVPTSPPQVSYQQGIHFLVLGSPSQIRYNLNVIIGDAIFHTRGLFTSSHSENLNQKTTCVLIPSGRDSRVEGQRK